MKKITISTQFDLATLYQQSILSNLDIHFWSETSSIAIISGESDDVDAFVNLHAEVKVSDTTMLATVDYNAVDNIFIANFSDLDGETSNYEHPVEDAHWIGRDIEGWLNDCAEV